jgi:4,5-dihydroxyphthalate decarboxylase
MAANATVLRTALDTYGHTQAIKDGTLSSPRLAFDFVDVNPMHDAFAPMVRTGAFELSEMAIVTFLQAFAFDKPIVLLPMVMLNRFHHGSMVCRTGSAIASVEDLAGGRIGVRAYTQTTGVWVRGILRDEYGLDLNAITSVTTEGGHVLEYADPPNVERVPEGKTLKEMLLADEIDAWIPGRNIPNIPEIRPAIADPDRAAQRWFERTRALPINHMVVLRRDVLDRDPWIGEELIALFARAKAAHIERLERAGPSGPAEVYQRELVRAGVDPLPFGVEALRRPLEIVIAHAYTQRLIPRQYAVDELFDERVRM